MYARETWLAIKSISLEEKAEQILLTLYSVATDDGMVVASERVIAAWTGLSRSTVWNRLHRLEKLGYLRVTRRRGAQTVFTVLIPGGAVC